MEATIQNTSHLWPEYNEAPLSVSPNGANPCQSQMGRRKYMSRGREKQHLRTTQEVHRHGSPAVMHWQPACPTIGHGGHSVAPSPDEVHVAADDGTVTGILRDGRAASGGWAAKCPSTQATTASATPSATARHVASTPQCPASGRRSPTAPHC